MVIWGRAVCTESAACAKFLRQEHSWYIQETGQSCVAKAQRAGKGEWEMGEGNSAGSCVAYRPG